MASLHVYMLLHGLVGCGARGTHIGLAFKRLHLQMVPNADCGGKRRDGEHALQCALNSATSGLDDSFAIQPSKPTLATCALQLDFTAAELQTGIDQALATVAAEWSHAKAPHALLSMFQSATLVSLVRVAFNLHIVCVPDRMQLCLA